MSLGTYIEKVRESGFWAGSLEIGALNRRFGKDIVLWQQQHGGDWRGISLTCSDVEGPADPQALNLRWEGNDHFDWLQPASGAWQHASGRPRRAAAKTAQAQHNPSESHTQQNKRLRSEVNARAPTKSGRIRTGRKTGTRGMSTDNEGAATSASSERGSSNGGSSSSSDSSSDSSSSSSSSSPASSPTSSPASSPAKGPSSSSASSHEIRSPMSLFQRAPAPGMGRSGSQAARAEDEETQSRSASVEDEERPAGGATPGSVPRQRNAPSKCKCGSGTHARTSHRRCPLNERSGERTPSLSSPPLRRQLHQDDLLDAQVGRIEDGDADAAVARAAVVARAAAVRDRGEMSEAEFLDFLMEQRVDGVQVFVHPQWRTPCNPPRYSGEHSAFMALMTEVWTRAQTQDGRPYDTVPVKRGWAKALLVGRIMRAPKGRATGLGIRKWGLQRRLQNLREGKFLKEMYDDSLMLYPLTRSDGAVGSNQGPAGLQDAAGVRLAAEEPSPHAAEEGAEDDSFLDRILRETPGAGAPLAKGVDAAVDKLLAQNLISRAAARVGDGKIVRFSEAATNATRALHPPARNLIHHDGSRAPVDNQPRLIITAAVVIAAAQSAPRGSTSGPDGLLLDMLTRPLLSVDPEAYESASEALIASTPKYAYIAALHKVIQTIADGRVPAMAALPLFSATGFALEKVDGSIRPIACGNALRRLAFRAVLLASPDMLQAALATTQFAICYPGGMEACKLGLEASLQTRTLALLWIDYKNAFNTTCRQLIKEAVQLFIPQWSKLYQTCYEMKTKFIVMQVNAEGDQVPGDIASQEGVQQGCPLGPALFCLAQRVIQLLAKRAKGEAIDLQAEGVSTHAIEHGVWDGIVARLESDQDLAGRIRAVVAERSAFELLNTAAVAESLGDQAAHAAQPDGPAEPMRAFMDDQYGLGLPGTLAFECKLTCTISEHFAGLVPNINKDKSKTGMFIPYDYGRARELSELFSGVIISDETPEVDRGVKVLGSYMRQSSVAYIEARLLALVEKTTKNIAVNILKLKRLQARYHLVQKSFVQKFMHLFRTLPPSLTAGAANALHDVFVRMFDYTTGGRRTKLNVDAGSSLLDRAKLVRLYLPYREGGMGLPAPHVVRYTAYLGCWRSLLAEDEGRRWSKSFPALAHYCTSNILGSTTNNNAATQFANQPLVSALQACVRFVADPRLEVLGALPAAPAELDSLEADTPIDRLLKVAASAGTISFEQLTGDRSCGQRELTASCLSRLSKRILNALLVEIGDNPREIERGRVIPLIRIHAAILHGSAPEAALTFSGLPSDARSTMTNQAWQINTQLRLGDPLGSYFARPHSACPHGCRHKDTKDPVKVRFGYHLVTDCKRANQGKKSHKDVEMVIMQWFNAHTSITASKAKPFVNGKQADIHLAGVNDVDNPDPRDWYIDVTSTSPLGQNNQEMMARSARNERHPRGPRDPRNKTLTSAAAAEAKKVDKYAELCRGYRARFQPFALETTGGHGESTRAIYKLFAKHLRDGGLPADVLLRKFKKEIAFALRNGTIAQVTTALERAKRAVEDELAVQAA
jgi:hypothetical protein